MLDASGNLLVGTLRHSAPSEAFGRINGSLCPSSATGDNAYAEC
jgi:hypothetical protein